MKGIGRALRVCLTGVMLAAFASSATAQSSTAGRAPTVGQAPRSETQPPPVAPITPGVNVLTPAGHFVFEPSAQYSYSSDSRVVVSGFTIIPALSVGVIDIRSVNRDFWTLALTGRYGVTNRLELETKLPWVSRSDSTLARPVNTGANADTEFTTTGSGISDIEVAARYQFTDHPPFYIGYLRFKSRTGDGPFDVPFTTPQPGITLQSELPTGTGFYAWQPGFTVLVPSDPAVFFGGASYIWNVKRNVSGVDASGTPIGNYDPGDGVNFNFGMGLSINDRSSFSIGYDHSIFRKDQRNGEVLPDAQVQQVATLLFGLSYHASLRQAMNLTLGVGLTPAAPNLTIALRAPVIF
ncbi:MAG TPA: hypothetical protein VFM23_07405 [Gemmatimonadales bacterium]|nr:hypothetical protein [Gemmatimonadales bacterium]